MTSDPDSSADEDFRMGVEPSTEEQLSVEQQIDYAKVDRRARFVFALLLAWASPFLVDGFAVLFLKSIGGAWFFEVFPLGAILGKFCLLSMWLAWGGSRVIWRMLVVMVSVAFTAIAVSMGRDAPLMFMSVLFLMILCASGIAIPRLFGVRWVEEWTHGADGPMPARRNQFSILDLLIWTATVAIIAGVMRGIGLPDWMDVLAFGFFCLIAVPLATCFVLLAMWSMLNKAESVGVFVFMNYIFALVLAFIVGAISRAPGEAMSYIFGSLVVAISCVLFALYQFRGAGDRLVRAKRSASAVHPTTPSEFDDWPGEWS